MDNHTPNEAAADLATMLRLEAKLAAARQLYINTATLNHTEHLAKLRRRLPVLATTPAYRRHLERQLETAKRALKTAETEAAAEFDETIALY